MLPPFYTKALAAIASVDQNWTYIPEMTLTVAGLLSDSRFPLHWDMSRTERLTLITLLDQLRPELSLEVGTYKGGSLQVLSHFSERVISVDVRPEVPIELDGRFDNVKFRTGDSRKVLPSVVHELNERRETPGFILIDGAHDTPGVRSDIETVLRFDVRNDVVVLMHDSFNPECRQGMREADWASSPHVHEVELDFVPGNLSPDGGDKKWANMMWAGFGCAIMRLEPRSGSLQIRETFKPTFEAVFRISAHARKSGWQSLFRPSQASP